MHGIRYLTEEELERFGKLTKKNPLNALAFHLTILGGLRVQELVNIKLEHFKWLDGAGKLWVERVKGGQKHHIALAPETERLYKRWMRVRNRLKTSRSNPFLFPSRLSRHRSRSRDSFQFFFRDVCNQAGIKDHSIHDLRHSAAVLLLLQGKNLATVRNQLGHTQISSTEVYLQFIETAKESKESSEYLSGLL
jgi:site-specific recombinase XerD